MARVLVRFSRPPGTATATFRLAHQAAGEAMLEHWHRTYVPMHFEPSATKRYGYQPRTKKYQKLKARKMHHQKPLVWSGESEAIATDPASFRISRRSANVTRGELTGLPRYFYQYQKNKLVQTGDGKFVALRSQPNKAEELTRVTPDEMADLERVGAARIVEFISHYSPPLSGVA